jgi:hypothetical protein
VSVGFRVEHRVFRCEGSKGLRAKSFGSRVQGERFRFWGLGSGV